MTEQYRFNKDSESVKMRYALLVGQIELSGISKECFDHTIWKHGIQWNIGDCYEYELTCVQNETLRPHINCSLWIGTIFDRDDMCISHHYAGEEIEEVFQQLMKHFLMEIERWLENGEGIDDDELTDSDEETEENRRRLDADDAYNDVMYPDTDLFDAYQ